MSQIYFVTDDINAQDQMKVGVVYYDLENKTYDKSQMAKCV